MRLKKIRQSQKISVKKLSEITGIHRRTIDGIELRNDCMVSNAIILADALNVTLDELCQDSKNQVSKSNQSEGAEE